jgi:hypothetical protein
VLELCKDVFDRVQGRAFWQDFAPTEQADRSPILLVQLSSMKTAVPLRPDLDILPTEFVAARPRAQFATPRFFELSFSLCTKSHTKW